MSKCKILGAVLLFTLGSGQPLFAQAAISEPGAYAFYHPDADVLNASRRTFRPFEPTNALASDRVSGYGAGVVRRAAVVRHHRR